LTASVVATKEPGRNASYRKILVGFDGSENAKRALGKAIGLAGKSGGDLTIVVVADITSHLPLGYGQFYVSIRDASLESARAALSQGSQTAKQASLTSVHESVEEGSPAEMILARASEIKADLIVVGSRGIRGIERFLMGSVSFSIVNHSKCDVLVVK